MSKIYDMERMTYDFIMKNKLLKNGDRVIVGLSGGADSTALFRILLALSHGIGIYEKNEKNKKNGNEKKIEGKKLDISIFAVHVNHNTRPNSLDDEQFCINLCNKFNIPIRIYNVNMESYAKKNRLSQEDAGRKLRYESFYDAAVFFSAGAIAVAHNKNDQAETFLMRIIRGTGLNGLSAIKAKRDNIIRPLLFASRFHIEEFLQNIDQPFCEDETNKTTFYTRNKVRLELIPVLERDFNPSIVDTLFRSAELMNNDNDYIELQAQSAYLDCKNPDFGLDINKLLLLHSAIAKRVIMLAYKNFSGTLIDLSSKHIDQTYALLRNSTGKKIALANNVTAFTEYGTLYFTFTKKNKNNKNNIGNKFCYVLSPEHTIFIKETSCYALLTKNTEYIMKNFSGMVYTKSLDCVSINSEVCLRSRQNGDVLFINGVGTKKLSDYFIDKKLPSHKRDKIPLLVVDNTVVCVVSFDKHYSFSNNKHTKKQDTKNFTFLYWES